MDISALGISTPTSSKVPMRVIRGLQEEPVFTTLGGFIVALDTHHPLLQHVVPEKEYPLIRLTTMEAKGVTSVKGIVEAVRDGYYLPLDEVPLFDRVQAFYAPGDKAYATLLSNLLDQATALRETLIASTLVLQRPGYAVPRDVLNLLKKEITDREIASWHDVFFVPIYALTPV